MKLFIRLALLCLLLCNYSFGQSSHPVAIQVMKQMMERYKAPGFISFEMNCKYSPEASPNEYLDSLKGAVKMSGNKYWYRMQESEFVYNGEYLITVFNGEKLIHLYKTPSSKGGQTGGVVPVDNPVLYQLDSLIRQKLIDIELNDLNSMYIVSINFLSHPSYKKMIYTIDKKSKLLHKVVYIVRTAELMGAEFQASGNDGGFAIVQTIFDHHSTERFDEDIFSGDRFFQKKNDRFVVSPFYEGYRIVTPNESGR
ncbi:MAG: hypothetical protein J7578_21665 [Chitinophagaceae bacterium]|nr:hypothetical protein [Chitinophagaceae bacterium]